MKNIKRIASITIVVLLALAGLSYVLARTAKSDFAGTKVISITSQNKDEQGTIYIVKTPNKNAVPYTVVQAKDLQASMEGIEPKHLLVEKGDTIKISINSDVYCNFFITGYDVVARTHPATTTEVTFTPHKEGMYEFGCERFLGSERGTLEVI